MPSITVKLLARVTDGENGPTRAVFLEKRSPGKKRKNGKLELPGGRVDKGESLTKALRRELREEEPSGVLADLARDLTDACLHPVKTGKKRLCYIGMVDIPVGMVGAINAVSPESHGSRVFRIDKFGHVTPHTKKLLKHVKKRGVAKSEKSTPSANAG